MTQQNGPAELREAGVLLHPTSLPGPGGQGDLGPSARRFLDGLAGTGFRVWQVLPVHPVHADRSPYRPRSTFAGHTGLLSAQSLHSQGLLSTSELGTAEDLPERRALVAAAWDRFRHRHFAGLRARHEQFRHSQAHWLEDYALFRALADHYQDHPWTRWPVAIRARSAMAVTRARRRHAGAIERECFGQFLFFEQWQALRAYAHERDIRLFGDLPLYVDADSADVWCHREFFTVDAEGQMLEVSGVPPDAFSPTGQLWGHPLYRWDRLAADGFRWWIERLRAQFDLFDLLRLDHFRGFESFWAIPGSARNAGDGNWRQGPGRALFDAVRAELGPLPMVAEDLGDITPAVDALRRELDLPGMRVLQFGFEGGPDNPHRPDNHTADSVAYTGTHDNDTTLGWWQSLPPGRRNAVAVALAAATGLERDAVDRAMPRPLVALALTSPARLAVLPVQDLLGLGSEARMNVPGTARGNWLWRLDETAVSNLPPDWITKALRTSGRVAENG